MTIAAHVTTGKGFHQDFLLDQLIFLANLHPNDHIITFVSDTSWYSTELPENLTPVVIHPAIRNRLLLYYWYNYRLPALLDRYNADAFISDALTLSSKTTRSQFLYISNNDFATSVVKHKSLFLKKYFPQFISLSRKIFFTEKYLQNLFTSTFEVDKKKSELIFNGLGSEYKPLNFLQKMAAITRFSRDNEYFLVPVSPSTVAQLTIVLKAFTIFKKWQKSSMNLVLLLFKIPEQDLIPNFKLYKFREEVITMQADDGEESMLAMGGAYSVIYITASFSPEPFGLNALCAGVPIVTIDNEFARYAYGNAALYCSLNEESLAEQMQFLYKDENMKNRLISNAAAQTEKYDLGKSSRSLYECMAIKSAG